MLISIYLSQYEVKLGVRLVHLVSLQQTEVGTAQQMVLKEITSVSNGVAKATDTYILGVKR